jgi:ATP-dependent Clp protease ATP-binding subunit ClpC
MHGYNFTDRVRRVLHRAREAAHELGHDFVGTEHVLLGFIREGEGRGVQVVANLGVPLTMLERATLDAVTRHTTGTDRPDLPYTAGGKRILEHAMSEARENNHPYVGTEHLLLGMVREGRGIAAHVLIAAGVTVEKARAEMLRVVAQPAPPAPPTKPDASPPVGFLVVVTYSNGAMLSQTFGTSDAARAFLDQWRRR